ncbi:polyprenyl synthetase family protein [Natronobiforma cellulositropha]|uniref:hypothetical protein n=1 Tax=Natronobiforma cellulositropha TaxID=1679076 RepID=UPI0021D5AE52|nr:hypothetical protein [Natronobiforma cellulositropha]
MAEERFDDALRSHVDAWLRERTLSPAVERCVADAVDPDTPTLSLSLALTRLSADVAPGRALSLETLLEVSVSVATLGGYLRLRRDILESGARTSARERDLALLASDHLHASAHSHLATLDLPPERHTDAYRELTAGSAALSRSFFETGDAGDGPETARHPTAILAGTGCALGCLVAGAPRDAVDAMRTYGESLLAALERLEWDEPEPARALERALTDGDASLEGPTPGGYSTTTHLERARHALGVLPDTDAALALERATDALSSASEPHH